MSLGGSNGSSCPWCNGPGNGGHGVEQFKFCLKHYFGKGNGNGQDKGKGGGKGDDKGDDNSNAAVENENEVENENDVVARREQQAQDRESWRAWYLSRKRKFD